MAIETLLHGPEASQTHSLIKMPRFRIEVRMLSLEKLSFRQIFGLCKITRLLILSRIGELRRVFAYFWLISIVRLSRIRYRGLTDIFCRTSLETHLKKEDPFFLS